MTQDWSNGIESRYRNQLERDFGKTYRSLFWIAVPFFCGFALVDWLVQPEVLVQKTFGIRLVTLVLMLPLCMTQGKFTHASLISTLLLSLTSISLTSIALLSNGFESPYFFGICLLIFFIPQVFAWSTQKTAAHVFSYAFFYLSALLIRDQFQILNLLRFTEVCAYLITSAVIATWGAKVADQLRRRFFLQQLKTEEANARIERTVKILQDELEAKNDDPISLSRALANRKVELQEQVCSFQESKAEISLALTSRDEFISIASHELKTPITALQMQSWMLKKFVNQRDLETSHPGILKYIERSEAQVKRLVRLVDDLLDLSRIRTGSFTLQPETVDLCAFVKEVVERYQPQFLGAGIRVQLITCDEISGVWDRLRLEQVISNLFNNAIKYAPGAPLEITVSQPAADEILLEIHDHGPGLSEENRSKIFERFERAGASRAISGLGLGLFISRQIIRGHGGEIKIDEQAQSGLCFQVILPKEPHFDQMQSL